ncbi:MAG: SAM-dependent methyltransferase [Blastocatellia bacterium]|nr:SAM-dependent methyltransferase [Blastocatellia bacterium]
MKYGYHLALMTFKQLAEQKKLLEDRLRRYGVEGEESFYLLASEYLLRFGSDITNPPERIIERGRKAFDRISHDEDLLAFIASIISSDPTGENLPVWYQHFLGRRFREGSGKFFTPRPVACAMSALIPCIDDAVIMDPTCGGGTFLIEASKRWKHLQCRLVANDIEASLVDLAQVVLNLATPGNHQKSFLSSNIYDPESQFKAWYGRVDYILANPPFSLQIETIDTDSSLFNLGYRNSDALFLDVCFNLLRPDGRLICLLPHSIVANTEYQRLRLAVEESWNLLGIVGLPEGVFHLTASTTTRADIVILEKKRAKHSSKRTKSVFAYAPSVGIPLNSRMIGQETNYLSQIVDDPGLKKVLGLG